jgi:UDP-N-acetylglucosamine 4,6-dehydratase/5-epimerase
MNPEFFNNKSVLLFGASGDLGQLMVEKLVSCGASRIAIMDKDEKKIISLRSRLHKVDNGILRYFLGSLRDRDRLMRAFDGIDILLVLNPFTNHNILDYNPMEAVSDFIYAYENIVNTAINQGISYVFSVMSSDYLEKKDISSLTKQCSEQILLAGNGLSSFRRTKFSLMRIGDIESFPDLELKIAIERNEPYLAERYLENSCYKIRFSVTLEKLTDSILFCMSSAQGGEIFIPASHSYSLYDLFKTHNINVKLKDTQEKSKQLLSLAIEAKRMSKSEGHYIVKPDEEWWDENIFTNSFPDAVSVNETFLYQADEKNLKKIKEFS